MTPDAIHRLTLEVLRADRWRTARDLDERYAAAHAAITEHWWTTRGAAGHADLLNAGVTASHAVVRQADQSHGLDLEHGGVRRNFGRYWDAVAARSLRSAENVETLRALVQILDALTEPHREALRAYAETGDKLAAAERLSLKQGTFNKRLRAARSAAAALWFEHETAPRLGRTRRPGARDGRWKGAPRLTEQQIDILRGRHHDGATYVDLAAELGVDADRLSQLIRGVRPAAPDHVAA